MTEFGKISKESDSFDRYAAEQWIQLESGSNMFYGKLGSVDIKKGEIIFSEITQYVYNEKGYVIGITKEPITFRMDTINRHRKASEQEVQTSIDTQSMWYRHFGEVVSIPGGGMPYLGRIHKILRDSIELLPFLNFECDKPYIEKERPLSLGTSSISQIVPRSEAELEHRVKEISKKIEEDKAKSNKTP